jgi:hypothetical protein
MLKNMMKRSEVFTNLQIKKELKKPLEQASYDLSSEFGERVPMTRILDSLIKNCLPEAMDIIRKEMNFEGK